MSADTQTDQLAKIEHDLDVIDATSLKGTLVDPIAIVWVRLNAAMSQGRSLKERVEEYMTKWIEANGPFAIGDTEFFLAPDKSIKCRDIRKTVTALYESVAGDFDAFCECLSVNAIKPGAAKKVLGDSRFLELFEVKVATDLEKRPVKSLQMIDKRFVH